MCALLFYLLFLTSINTAYTLSKKEEPSYGKFFITVDNAINCKGPKRRDCGVNRVQVINRTIILYDFILPKSLGVTRVKLGLQAKGNYVLALDMKKCDNRILKHFIMTVYNATDDCVIRQGRYISRIDVNKFAKLYYGESFVYGNYTIKSLFLSDSCNLSCTFLKVQYLPKK